MISLIVAVDNRGGFGKDGKIPWHFPEDFKFFKEKTKGKVCVMGKRTYVDMLEMAQARGRDISNGILPERTCYVVSSTLGDDIEGATRINGLRQAIENHPDQEIVILGGEKLYIEALSQATTVYMTCIDHHYECDRHFPVDLLTTFKITDGNKITASDGTELMFVTYTRKDL